MPIYTILKSKFRAIKLVTPLHPPASCHSIHSNLLAKTTYWHYPSRSRSSREQLSIQNIFSFGRKRIRFPGPTLRFLLWLERRRKVSTESCLPPALNMPSKEAVPRHKLSSTWTRQEFCFRFVDCRLRGKIASAEERDVVGFHALDSGLVEKKFECLERGSVVVLVLLYLFLELGLSILIETPFCAWRCGIRCSQDWSRFAPPHRPECLYPESKIYLGEQIPEFWVVSVCGLWTEVGKSRGEVSSMGIPYTKKMFNLNNQNDITKQTMLHHSF